MKPFFLRSYYSGLGRGGTWSDVLVGTMLLFVVMSILSVCVRSCLRESEHNATFIRNAQQGFRLQMGRVGLDTPPSDGEPYSSRENFAVAMGSRPAANALSSLSE